METKKEKTAATEKDGEKKKRMRLKKLCAQIRNQVEFYFSDANLHKDRFLIQEIQKSDQRFVDLEVLSKFNKLRNLTTDMSLVAKALSTSTSIEVSPDQGQIRRKTPLAPPQDVEKRTVYVECLPATADHDWLRKTFSACGPVAYVSLPRYKTTGDIKGFAFIEYEKVESAKQACESLNNPPASASDKAGRFPKSNKQLRTVQKQMSSSSSVSKTESEITEIENKSKRGGRRRHTLSETSDEDGFTSKKNRKRSRSNSEGSDASNTNAETMTATASRKRKQAERAEAVVRCQEDEDAETSSPSKRSKKNKDDSAQEKTEDLREEKKDTKIAKREGTVSDAAAETTAGKAIGQPTEAIESCLVSPRRKRKSDSLDLKVSEKKKVRISEKPEVREVEAKKKKRKRKKRIKEKREVPEIRVISKDEWTQLRDEYLNLQRANMKNLKKSLLDHAAPPQRGRRAAAAAAAAAAAVQGQNEESADMEADQPSDSRTAKGAATQPTFTPNVIIKVTSTSPMSRQQIKEFLAEVADIVYVDIKDEDVEGYIRCADTEAASKLAGFVVEENTFALLQGDEEKAYWHKILADREKKRSSKSKVKKRGRDRIIQRADRVMEEIHNKKHVFFED